MVKKGGNKQRLCSIWRFLRFWCVNIQTSDVYTSVYTWCFMQRIGTYPDRRQHIHNQAILRGVLGLKTYIEERAVEVAKFMITTNATVRETAKKFGISKSTVHKDITDRVERIDPDLAKSVRAVLEVNKAERHIRGGLATREKYLHNKNT